jgi:hypothetical protein
MNNEAKKRIEPLPCPFDGGSTFLEDDDDGLTYRCCRNCNARGPLCSSNELATEFWNKRLEAPHV